MDNSTEEPFLGSRTLRVLIVEDLPEDAELVEWHLTKAGYDVMIRRVACAEEMAEALASENWDVIIADYRVPGFGALPALQLLKQSGYDIPFIIVSGTISDEIAVAAMRAGAHDYLLKSNIARLVPAIAREIQEAAERRQRRKAEAALHEADEAIHVREARLEGIIGSAMDAILSVDRQQRLVVFNRAAEQMFLCAAADALGSTLDRFVPTRFREIHRSHICNFGEAGVTSRSMSSPGLLTALRTNGEEFPIEATISQVEAAGQKLYTVILRDVTERKRTVEALRQSEERFRSMYQNAAVGIEQVAIDGRLCMVNPALCKMLGYSESELVNKTFGDITHQDDRAREDELLHAMLRGERGFCEIEKRYLLRDGSPLWVSVTSSLVEDADGHPLYRISIVQDMSEKKRAELLQEQLRQSQKLEAVGQLAGGIAHDFNTLLSVMLGYAELLTSKLPEEDPRRQDAEQIESAAQMGAVLTKQLLAFSRKQAVLPQVIDLGQAIARMEPMLKRLLPEDVELHFRHSSPAFPIKIDPGHLRQLVLNLATNARDAMPDGGNFTLEVKRVELDEAYIQHRPSMTPGAYEMLAVSDTGMGMTPETVARIFEPFFTTKELGKGTGLGMSTVYGIVKQSGGDIWVYSEPGVGTTFKIYFPKVTEPIAVNEIAGPTPQRLSGNETILLVEDSGPLRQLTREILAREGYAILEAADGLRALEVFRQYGGKIHLLMTDIVMPKLRGTELAAKITQEHPDLAIVFLSGYTEEAVSRLHGQAKNLDSGKAFYRRCAAPNRAAGVG